MRKLAVFVEGATELLFVDRLLTEIGGERVVTEHREIMGGGKSGKVPRAVKIIKKGTGLYPDKRFFVLIYDCGGDQQVATRIREEHEGLTKSGYSKIIGIRDVFPDYALADVPKLEVGLRKYIKTSLIPVEFFLAIMEIEAWFLAEFNHFPKIDPLITIAKIRNQLGFDPESDDLSLRVNPANDLNSVYRIGGKSYEKGTETTINALDYSFMYLELSEKIPNLKRLGISIDEFLQQTSPAC